METGQNPPSEVFPEIFIAAIIDMGSGLVLLKDNKEAGFALPRVNFKAGQNLEECALHLIYNESGLDTEITRQFHCYSSHKKPYILVTFVARGWGRLPKDGMSAFHEMNVPPALIDEDKDILRDYFLGRY